MQALMKTACGPGHIELVEIARPECGEGEVLG